jgi:hypothetical protein
MTNKARNATLFGIAAGLVMVPIVRAVIRRYGKRRESPETFSGAPPNRLFAAYRGRYKPHRRKADHNGVH